MTHELSLLAGLLDRIEAIASENEASRVVSVRLRLGPLAQISADHLREHFEEATLSGIAAGAHLDIICTDDIYDPNAQDILLDSVELEVAE